MKKYVTLAVAALVAVVGVVGAQQSGQPAQKPAAQAAQPAAPQAGKPESVQDRAAYVIGWFDDVGEMEKVYDRYKGKTQIELEASNFRLK